MAIGEVLGEAWALYKRFLKQFFLTAFVVFAVLDLLSALANSAAGNDTNLRKPGFLAPSIAVDRIPDRGDPMGLLGILVSGNRSG